MPRSTKSAILRAQKEAAEQTLHPDGSPTELMSDEFQVEDVDPRDIPAVINANELSASEIEALHARDFNWDTMRWAPAKRTNGGTRPCLCNRIAGGECDLTTKSRFSIGHDARFKGILQHAFREGRQVRFSFVTEDHAVVTDADGTDVQLTGEIDLSADVIARLVAPKLLPHVTHQSRAAKLQRLDVEAGTTVPQTAVENTPDEELTDADVDAQPDDTADAGFQEA